MIAIETCQSNMTLLDAFTDFEYSTGIVYDILGSSTLKFAQQEILLRRAAERLTAAA